MRELLAAIGCALLCAIALAQAPNNTGAARKQKPEQQQRGTKEAPVFVEALVRPEANQAEAAREAKQREAEAARSERSAKANEAVADYTTLMFFAMLAQAALFVWQLINMSRGAKESRGALVAAREAADAAKASADALQRIEKAYVFAEVHLDSFNTSVMDRASPWGTLKATLKFWNHGKTPAAITMVRGYAIVLEEVPHELLNFPDAELELPPSLGIGAGASFTRELDFELRIEDFSAIKNWDKRIYFAGKMEYMDVLGKPRITSFCWHMIYRDAACHLIPTRESKLNYQT